MSTLTSAVTRLTYGYSDLLKPVIFVPHPESTGVALTRLWIAKSFEYLLKPNAIALKRRWLVLWEGDISSRTISRALKKIGFTRKNKPTVTLKEMKNYALEFGDRAKFGLV